MNFHYLTRLTVLALPFFFIVGVASVPYAEEKSAQEDAISGLQQRIDFGNAYILGQSIKSGAVYLLHRKQSEIKGMLEVRQDYRKEIMEDFSLEKTAIVSVEQEEQSKDKGPEPGASKLHAEKK